MSNLKDIFRDYYKEMLYALHPLKSVIENIKKMIGCGDSSQGGAFWGCSDFGAGNYTPWRIVNHFDYHFLRKSFRKVLLDHMNKHIGS